LRLPFFWKLLLLPLLLHRSLQQLLASRLLQLCFLRLLCLQLLLLSWLWL
jgi:hypothetical protein